MSITSFPDYSWQRKFCDILLTRRREVGGKGQEEKDDSDNEE